MEAAAAEKNPLHQMQEAFVSDRCPICEMPKASRKHWFCLECWKLLPKQIAAPLMRFIYSPRRPRAPIETWMQAMAILKQERLVNKT